MRTSFNPAVLKRPLVFGPIVAIIVLALVWWLAWESPENAKLASVQQQQTAIEATQARLTTELALLQAEAKQVHVGLPFLRRYEQAIPPTPEAPQLVTELDALALRTGVTLSSVADNTLTPPAKPGGLTTIPVSMSISGTHAQVLAFIQGLYSLPRLLTLTTVSLSVPSGGNVLNLHESLTYGATISAVAYTSYAPPAATP